MSYSSIFLFQDNKDDNDYDLYLFKDFTGYDEAIHDDIFDELDEVRQRIHSPNIIFIICINQELLDKDKITKRFVDNQNIKYIDYKDVKSNVFKTGISEISIRNKVVQRAPHGTRFKKTSGDESDYFIKASLSLLEYSEICFIALATYQKITPKKLENFKKIYIDTSSITSLVQAMVNCFNTLQDSKINPKIINFKSYKKNNIDFNTEDSFTIISASTSGNLRKDNHINNEKCLTIFYPKDENSKEICLFHINNINNNHNCTSPRLIPLTSEDFSLEYSKSNEIIIKQKEIEEIDCNNLIEKILGDEFKDISFNFSYNEIKKRDCLIFDHKKLYGALQKNKYIEDTFSRALSLESSNCIIYDYKQPRPNIDSIKKEDFINKKYKDTAIEGMNIVVFLIQATDSDLINISQKLRKFTTPNITYIIGALISDNFQQSKNLENNIRFNDTEYKYDFYCYLNLPLATTVKTDIASYKLTNGFVFYKKVNAAELHPNQIYLVVCLILELLRSNDLLTDNISHHDVVSPKNFSRFNDSLLQLSLLSASKYRELNFYSNVELSKEMKDVIMDMMKEKNDVGIIFVEALIQGRIRLTDEDLSIIKKEYQTLFLEKDEI